MSRWLTAGALIAAGGLLLFAGLVDDLVRIAIWELFAAAGALLWYGPARRLWHRKE